MQSAPQRAITKKYYENHETESFHSRLDLATMVGKKGEEINDVTANGDSNEEMVIKKRGDGKDIARRNGGAVGKGESLDRGILKKESVSMERSSLASLHHEDS